MQMHLQFNSALSLKSHYWVLKMHVSKGELVISEDCKYKEHSIVQNTNQNTV